MLRPGSRGRFTICASETKETGVKGLRRITEAKLRKLSL